MRTVVELYGIREHGIVEFRNVLSNQRHVIWKDRLGVHLYVGGRLTKPKTDIEALHAQALAYATLMGECDSFPQQVIDYEFV